MQETVSSSKKVKRLIQLLYAVRFSHIKKEKLKLISDFKYQKTLRRILSIVYDYTLPIYFSSVELQKSSSKFKDADGLLIAEYLRRTYEK